MTLRIGVIGTGMIGREHVRRIDQRLSGADVVAVSDTDADVAQKVAQSLPDAGVIADGVELIAHDAVDAVVVSSWGPTHERFVLAAIAAGKPVFCEKPLATTERACRAVLDAEVGAGRRLVQVGFMRRFDRAYRALKRVVDEGRLGAPLMFFSSHRNVSVPAYYPADGAIVDTAVHDVDVARWLLDDELATVEVLPGRRSRNSPDVYDPLLFVLRTRGDVLVSIETSVNIRYGYDIRGEVVCEDGSAALGDGGSSGDVVLRAEGRAGPALPADWRERFAAAYDAELQHWIDAIGSGCEATGPSTWDGYAAQVVCDAGVRSLDRGERMPIELIERPALYA